MQAFAPLDVKQGGDPPLLVIRAPESSKAICRVFMLLPPPPPHAKLSLSAQQQVLFTQLLSDGTAALTASPFGPFPLPKSNLSVIQSLEDGKIYRPTILTGVEASDRQLPSPYGKPLDPSLKYSWRRWHLDSVGRPVLDTREQKSICDKNGYFQNR